jgi:hypothetical protein
MRSRIFFVAIVVFWLAMNGLLLRSQWGAHSRIGSAVPPEMVWDKMLDSPDPSSLGIYDHDRRIGSCRWVANVGNSPLASNRILADDYAPDEAGGQITGYTLAFYGNSALGKTNGLRFQASLSLSTNRQWKEFYLRVNVRPVVWTVHASAAAERLMLKVEDGSQVWQRIFKFSDLRDPEALWGGFGGTSVLSLLAGAGLAPDKESFSQLSSALPWQAHEDWMQFGHTKARVYRVETWFLGRHYYLFTSRVGEILWVELPDKLTLRNEAFEHF